MIAQGKTTGGQGNGAKPNALEVAGLRVYYDTPRGAVKAVDGVSFDLRAGEKFGLVGESGSGKSTMALAIMRMIHSPGRVAGGEVWLDGRNLLQLSEEAMRDVRLSKLALIAQGSMNSLNPVMRIRAQIVDAFQDHEVRLSRQEQDDKIAELLRRVGLEPSVAGMYPHELSGGMKQRVCIAISISLRPTLIIADEPTSALDVVVQRHVMETLAEVQTELGAALILVGHDMGLMAQFVDRLAVMYAGKMMEVAPTADIFTRPRHPYTQLLIASLPSIEEKGEFRGIPGLPPSLLRLPPGCPFNPRCPRATDLCRTEEPALREVAPDCLAACHYA